MHQKLQLIAGAHPRCKYSLDRLYAHASPLMRLLQGNMRDVTYASLALLSLQAVGKTRHVNELAPGMSGLLTALTENKDLFNQYRNLNDQQKDPIVKMAQALHTDFINNPAKNPDSLSSPTTKLALQNICDCLTMFIPPVERPAPKTRKSLSVPASK